MNHEPRDYSPCDIPETESEALLWLAFHKGTVDIGRCRPGQDLAGPWESWWTVKLDFHAISASGPLFLSVVRAAATMLRDGEVET